MRKNLHLLLNAMRLTGVIMMALVCTSLSATTAEAFLTEDDYADYAAMFCPPGPNDPLFFNDLCQHARAHELWGTPRAEAARQDYPWDIGVAKRFEEAYGQAISQEETPELYVLLERTAMDASIAIQAVKKYYKRVRPYVYFGESTLISDDEEVLRTNGSFPSGHSVIGWVYALLLGELAPERQNEIFKRGLDFGLSRVIANYHWQSDIEVGRVIASMVVARLHACGAFREQLDRARQERRAGQFP